VVEGLSSPDDSEWKMEHFAGMTQEKGEAKINLQRAEKFVSCSEGRLFRGWIP
jgi:hypothetical protein